MRARFFNGEVNNRPVIFSARWFQNLPIPTAIRNGRIRKIRLRSRFRQFFLGANLGPLQWRVRFLAVESLKSRDPHSGVR